MSRLAGRLRELRPYWVKILPQQHKVTEETEKTQYFPLRNFHLLNCIRDCDNVTTPYYPIFIQLSAHWTLTEG